MPPLVKSLFLLLIAQACVGINIVLSKGLVDHINPFVIMTIRFSLASLFMSFLLVRSKETKKLKSQLAILTKKDWLVMILKGIGAGLLFNLMMLSGLHFTNANSAGLITSLLPAIVVVLSVVFFKQRLSKNMLIAIMISVAGLILINMGTFGGNSKNALIGNLLILASLIPEGLYYTLSKYYSIDLPPAANALLLNALNLPFLYVIIAFMPASSWSTITWHDGIIMTIIGLATGFFFLCWQRGIEQVDAAYAALSTAFMPLATVVLAWVILGEVLTMNKFIGMLLILLSIISYARKQES